MWAYVVDSLLWHLHSCVGGPNPLHCRPYTHYLRPNNKQNRHLGQHNLAPRPAQPMQLTMSDH